MTKVQRSPPGLRFERLELIVPDDAYHDLSSAIGDLSVFALERSEARKPRKHRKPNTALVSDTPLVWTVDFDQDRIFYDRDGLHLVYEFTLPLREPLKSLRLLGTHMGKVRGHELSTR